MHDLVVMTVVDTPDNLAGNNRSIRLGELSSLHDLVEKFTSTAYLSNDIVVLLVFVVLKYFDDIWVV